MALADAAHAVTTQVTGPRMLKRIEANPAASLGMIIVTARGLIREAPRSSITLMWLSKDSIPPRPEPTTTPARSASDVSATKSRPDSSMACWAAHMKSCAERSSRRASLLGMMSSGSQPRTSPANLVCHTGRIELGDRTDPGLAGQGRLPGIFDSVTERGDGAHTGHHHPPGLPAHGLIPEQPS